MATDKSTSTKETTAAPLSFQDAYGATVTIPAGEVQAYAGCRAEQLRTLTQILAAGRSIDLPPSAIEMFQVMANELASAMENLIDLVADDTANSMKGGE